MSAALLVARLLLAATFAVAAAAKLADRPGSRSAVRNFGVPEKLAGAVATSIPVAELVVAISLLPRGSARFGAIGAVLLLVLFGLGTARLLRRGERPDCHCFGRLYSAPVSRATIMRVCALAGIAAFVAIAGWHDPGTSAVGWRAGLNRAELAWLGVGVAIVAFQAWFSWQLLRQQGRLLLRIEQLETRRGVAVPRGRPVASIAPDFSLPAPDGARRSLEQVRAAGNPVLLLFSDPACGPCHDLWPKVAGWCADHATALYPVLISRRRGAVGPAGEIESYGLDVLLDEEGAVAQLYQVVGTPGAVLVDHAGRIAAPPALGADAIFQLMENGHSLSAASDGDRAPRLHAGDLVPRSVAGAGIRGEQPVAVGSGADWGASDIGNGHR